MHLLVQASQMLGSAVLSNYEDKLYWIYVILDYCNYEFLTCKLKTIYLYLDPF